MNDRSSTRLNTYKHGHNKIGQCDQYVLEEPACIRKMLSSSSISTYQKDE